MKIVRISELYFALPDDWEGTRQDAEEELGRYLMDRSKNPRVARSVDDETETLWERFVRLRREEPDRRLAYGSNVLELVDGRWVDIVGEVEAKPNTNTAKEADKA